ncbi:MAG: S8 family peptidase [Acidimicrobiales bacterium]
MSSTATSRLPRPKQFVLVAVAAMLMATLFAPPGAIRAAAPSRTQAQATNFVDVDPALLSTPLKGDVRVIVQSLEGASPATQKAITKAGGTVTLDLPLINGVAATLAAAKVADLAAVPGIRAISLDRPVTVQSDGGGGSANSVYRQVVRADEAWDAGLTGSGVTVAVLDTGIADVPDLAGRVLPIRNDLTGQYSPCVNLSGEANCGDSYGHGTFVAGLIAGNGASSNGEYKGVAPGANLVSIKVAGRDGSSDVSNVIAGIQWAVSFRDSYGIKALNLSLGTDGTQSFRTDPLNYAVEEAWSSGITVVVAASNRGPAAGTISKPGDDPWVITVGAIDDRGTPGLGDDQLPNFSSRGPTAADGLAKPDVVAPGAHVVSLRAPGSSIDTLFPGTMGPHYRRGSGTSMATGVVSGTVALMLQANPTWAPDRVKFALMGTARPDASSDPMAVGRGLIDAYAAALAAPSGTANQGLARSNGLGSLNLSRGTVRVSADNLLGTVVSGLLTTQLLLWNPLLYTITPWNGSSWYASSWYGSSWYGSSWYGSSWYGSSWYGSSWYGQPNGSSWYGSSWYGSSWYGAWE